MGGGVFEHGNPEEGGVSSFGNLGGRVGGGGGQETQCIISNHMYFFFLVS